MRTNFSDSYDRRTVGNMKSLFPQKALYSSIRFCQTAAFPAIRARDEAL